MTENDAPRTLVFTANQSQRDQAFQWSLALPIVYPQLIARLRAMGAGPNGEPGFGSTLIDSILDGMAKAGLTENRVFEIITYLTQCSEIRLTGDDNLIIRICADD